MNTYNKLTAETRSPITSYIAFSPKKLNVHYHQCYQLILSLSNSFDCKINNDHLTNIRGFVVNRKVSHTCYAENSDLLIVLIETDSCEASGIRDLLKDKPYMDISPIEWGEYKNLIADDYKQRPSYEMIPFVKKILDHICQPRLKPKLRLDDRVAIILKHIDASIEWPIRLNEVAALVFLSPERTRHLFSEQIGMPFSDYVLWKKIKATLNAVVAHKFSFHKACLRYGFTDQPHFNRTFKKRFGMPPSGILNYCMVIG